MSAQPINRWRYLKTPGIVIRDDDDRFIIMDEKPRDIRDGYSPFIITDEKPRDMRDMFPIRDRIDLFLGGLAGFPSFEVFPPDIDSPGENAARERYRQQNPGPVRGRTWDQIQRDMSLIRARMGLKGV